MHEFLEIPLGVITKDHKILLYALRYHGKMSTLVVKVSTDGTTFTNDIQRVNILGPKNHDSNKDIKSIRISKLPYTYLLLSTVISSSGKYIINAFSTDVLQWFKIGTFTNIQEIGMVIPEYTYNNKFILVYGESSIHIATSTDLKKWSKSKKPLLEARKDHFDDGDLIVATVIHEKQHILLIYYNKTGINDKTVYSIGAAILDKKDPKRVIWRSDKPLWKQSITQPLHPIGTALFNNKLFFYWEGKNHALLTFSSEIPRQAIDLVDKPYSLLMKRFDRNPIIKPIPHHSWESKATFNSAAIYENNKVHFLYRAMGDQDISAYTSGGGYGGVEDPRITKLDNRLYMTYVAYDGWSPPRVALTSISTNDFLQRNWNWENPKLISPPGIVDKNACILPEKINGKYVIFHRIFPNILIDYVDDLSFHNYLKGEYLITPEANSWDSLKVGIGAPPIKTSDGWLIIYQAVGYRDSGRYKIGAMLLDLDNPTKVLCRSKNPIIEPLERYENEGHKAGVVYPCGAVVINNKLHVYYGGADMVLCVATSDLPTLLSELKTAHTVHMDHLAYN